MANRDHQLQLQLQLQRNGKQNEAGAAQPNFSNKNKIYSTNPIIFSLYQKTEKKEARNQTKRQQRNEIKVRIKKKRQKAKNEKQPEDWQDWQHGNPFLCSQQIKT